MINEQIKKLNNELLSNFKYPYNNSNLRYVGISIYSKKKRNIKCRGKKNTKDSYMIEYSNSLYVNKSGFLKSSSNDLTGYIFHYIQGNEKGEEISGKSFDYLKLFFQDIEIVNDCYNTFFKAKICKNYYLQIIFVYKYKPNSADEKWFSNILKNYKFKNNLENLTKNIQLPETRILRNASIIIIDLIRNSKRKNYPNLIYADASVTRKMIFDISKIITQYGFFITNHTGDGFMFICEQDISKKILLKHIEAILFELESYFIQSMNFFSSVNNFVLDYKIRLLVDKVKTIFEMNDIDSASKKLYFSPDLDKSFDKMRKTTKHDKKHLLILDSFYQKIEWVSQNFEIEKSKCTVQN